jgi:hypothetical protein
MSVIDDNLTRCDCGCGTITVFDRFLFGPDLDGVIRDLLPEHADRYNVFPCDTCYIWRPNSWYDLEAGDGKMYTCAACRRP